MNIYFANIRFTVGPEGHYVESCCRVCSRDLLEATNEFLTFVEGYSVGSGLNALIQRIDTSRPLTEDLITDIHTPEHVKQLRDKLKPYMEKHSG